MAQPSMTWTTTGEALQLADLLGQFFATCSDGCPVRIWTPKVGWITLTTQPQTSGCSCGQSKTDQTATTGGVNKEEVLRLLSRARAHYNEMYWSIGNDPGEEVLEDLVLSQLVAVDQLINKLESHIG